MTDIPTKGLCFNLQPQSTCLTQIKNTIRNPLVKRRGKIKIINVLEQNVNCRLTRVVCPSLITNYFLPRLMFEGILF